MCGFCSKVRRTIQRALSFLPHSVDADDHKHQQLVAMMSASASADSNAPEKK